MKTKKALGGLFDLLGSSPFFVGFFFIDNLAKALSIKIVKYKNRSHKSINQNKDLDSYLNQLLGFEPQCRERNRKRKTGSAIV